MKILYRIALFIIFSIGLITSAQALRSGQAMDSFTDIPLPALSESSLTQTKVEDALVKAGLKRGWVIKKNADGTMNAHLTVRVHTLDLIFKLHDGKYDIRYVDSTNLEYKANPDDPNRPFLHPKVNGWIKFLISDFNAQLASP